MVLLATVLVSGAAVAVSLRSRAAAPSLAGEAAHAEAVGVRFSVGTRFRACHFARWAAGETRGEGCAAPTPPQSTRIFSLVRSAAEAARTGDAEALHRAALAALLFDGRENQLGSSISSLQSASKLARRPAPVLADLAAAHLLRAQLTRQPQDLIAALEAAEQALEKEPELPAARFNAAEALDRIGIEGQATAAWRRYLAVDSTSDWAAEARRRQALLTPAPLPQKPAADAPVAVFAAYANAAPKEARELGWDELLGEWARATLEDDTATAAARLQRAAAMGQALAHRGGDRTLARETDAILRSAADVSEIRQLAQAHAAFSDGRAEFLATKYAPARARFEEVIRSAPSAPLRDWARLFVGMTMIYGPRPGEDAVSYLSAVARDAERSGEPALAGRAWWAVGAKLQLAGRYEENLVPYRRAAPLLERSRESEFAAAVRMQVAYAEVQLGSAEAGYRGLFTALQMLRDRSRSVWHFNTLYALRNAAASDGLVRVALRAQDEMVAVTEQMPQAPHLLAEARLGRARMRESAGLDDVAGDVDSASAIVARLPESYMREWLLADLGETRALRRLRAEPAQALSQVDTAVAIFASSKRPERLVSALFTRAEAYLAAGTPAAAEADLRRAVTVLDTMGAHVQQAELRASLLERSRRVFDRSVMLHVAAGDTVRALDQVERSRASFSAAPRPWRDGRPLAPARPGEVSLELALVGDTLLAWTLDAAGLLLTRTTLDRTRLAQTAERLRAALELRAPEASLRPELETLYDQLIRPVQDHLGPAGTPLVIVADGELAAIPLSALRDRRTGRYLMQDHPLRFASTLRDPARPRAPPGPGTPVTLIADPAFDPAEFPLLDRLPRAADEAAALERRYPGAAVVRDHEADAVAISAALRRGGVVHVAGHAVFDDARPERSYLVVAPGRGSGSRLTASEIQRMDLGGLRLVVLAACETSRTQAGRSGGFAGLSGAFLAAGSGGVLGSLWKVDDASTGALMTSFHRAYAASGDPAAALRQAQLELLASKDPKLSSPAAWAGFRYAGG